MKYLPSSFFLYGGTRTGKTRLFGTLLSEGRGLIADVDGQAIHEYPDSWELPADVKLSDGTLAEAIAGQDAQAASVWRVPLYSLNDWERFLRIYQRGGFGPDIGVSMLDSATFWCDLLIRHITEVPVEHKAGSAEDQVLPKLPNVGGDAGKIDRKMEMEDWGRFGSQGVLALVEFKRAAARLRHHHVLTALDEKKELFKTVANKRIPCGIRPQPHLPGNMLPLDLPPQYNFFFHTLWLEDETPTGGQFAIATRPQDGWPAGSRGAAFQALQPIEVADLGQILAKVEASRPK